VLVLVTGALVQEAIDVATILNGLRAGRGAKRRFVAGRDDHRCDHPRNGGHLAGSTFTKSVVPGARRRPSRRTALARPAAFGGTRYAQTGAK
jgi:hypothetical protein